MTKAEIVNEIAKKTGIEKSVVLTTVESFMDVVKTSLATTTNKTASTIRLVTASSSQRIPEKLDQAAP